ncbi:SDR family oxidoreductase [Fodinicola acaciae]|uniref:SDR family oxidoreductase n=1 Tax=Fodinicola acaciae TaxID=2681555 RepID=UPI0013D7338A|nr:SDR family oxidoreductase [Fodinicola acaciae]
MAKVTIVTGGGRGIGAATARRLVAGGHAVALSYLSDVDSADKLVAELGADNALAVRGDMASETDVDELFARTTEKFGPVTGLVNNAGYTGPLGPFPDVTGDVLRRVVEVNILGLEYCTQRAVKVMSTERGGSGGAIVNLSSGAATIGSPGEYVHYAASKAAVDAFTVGLSKEVGGQGIRVNAVAPGLVATRIHADAGDPGRVERMAPGVPIGRPGEPDEIAAAICWLLSDDASYTTGAILRVAGGR